MSYATLAELRTHPGIPASGDDALLQAYLDAATSLINGLTNSGFTESVVTDETHSGRGSQRLRLRHRPVLSVQAVRIDDTAIDTTLYALNELGWVVLEEGEYNPRIWRSAQTPGWAKGVNNIEVDYTWGYTDVPADVNMACRMLAAHLYQQEQRRGVASESYGPVSRSYTKDDVPMTAQVLLGAYVQHEVAG